MAVLLDLLEGKAVADCMVILCMEVLMDLTLSKVEVVCMVALLHLPEGKAAADCMVILCMEALLDLTLGKVEVVCTVALLPRLDLTQSR